MTTNVRASFSNRLARYRRDTAFSVVMYSVPIKIDPTSSVSPEDDGIMEIIDGDEKDDCTVSMVPFAIIGVSILLSEEDWHCLLTKLHS